MLQFFLFARYHISGSFANSSAAQRKSCGFGSSCASRSSSIRSKNAWESFPLYRYPHERINAMASPVRLGGAEVAWSVAGRFGVVCQLFPDLCAVLFLARGWAIALSKSTAKASVYPPSSPCVLSNSSGN